jgi:CxxC-x17-CxxC domain-containing protein
MSYDDRNLTCADCGQSFIFSADDQAYHAEKGYTNEPKRCPTCRQSRRDRRGNDGFGFGGGGYSQGPREMHSVVCAECGQDAQVPFKPRGDRPVYCSDCYSRQGGRSTPSRY